MKAINLLNRIVNKKNIPKKIVFKGKTYYWCNNEFYLTLDKSRILDRFYLKELNEEVIVIEGSDSNE